MELDEITGAVIDTAILIHRRLGPGVFESVYETVLASRLERRGLHVERQRLVGLTFDGIRFDRASGSICSSMTASSSRSSRSINSRQRIESNC